MAEKFGKADAERTAEELEELEHTAEAVGYGAVKYADLKNNRLTDYKFSYDQMLNDKGDTAVYVLYAHSRACSILQKSGKDIEKLKNEAQIVLDEDEEHKLGLHLLRFAEAFEESCINFSPNVLCEYLYGLAEKFTDFYQECKVVGSPQESSRLLLCEATRVVMRNCLQILGITPLDRI
ncbi:arginine-tRNA ligase [Artemisia annua]|uniref:arginine--tRNA ligase n=1 Tax=Artemisia annua TaxID=35608 RepID=A0A2U1NZH3_ARTAN|nr:arginine-tRNA ligase [Artemisia annua]